LFYTTSDAELGVGERIDRLVYSHPFEHPCGWAIFLACRQYCLPTRMQLLRDLDAARQDMADQGATYKGSIAALSAGNSALKMELRDARQTIAAADTGSVLANAPALAEATERGERGITADVAAAVSSQARELAGLRDELRHVSTAPAILRPPLFAREGRELRETSVPYLTSVCDCCFLATTTQ